MKYSRKISSKQKGMSTIEILFVLIVITIALAFAVQKGYSLFARQTNNTEQTNVAELIMNTRSLKSSQGYGTTGTNLVPQLVATKGIPSGLTVASNVPYNSWNGAVTVVSAGVSFTITYQDVPQDACVTLATKVAKAEGFTTRINSGTATSGEITPAVATAGCSSDSNTIAWTVSA